MFSFVIFFTAMHLVLCAFLIGLYLAGLFIAFTWLPISSILEPAMVAYRVVVVTSLILTTSWIFSREGRREWA